MTKAIQTRNWSFLREVNSTGRVDTRYPDGETSTEEPGALGLVTTNISVTEGNTATITASRTGGTDGSVAVDWGVSGSLTSPGTGTLNWADGESGNKSATPTASLVEANTAGTVTLSNARRTDGGSPAPTLGASTGAIQVHDSGSGYDLAAALATLPAEFAGITLPTAPTITQPDITVSTTTELNNAMSVSGRRILVSPGTYGAISVTGTDKIIRFLGAATLDSVNFNAQRIRLESVSPRVVNLGKINGVGTSNSDIWIENFNCIGGGEGANESSANGAGPYVYEFMNELQGGRWAIIGCYIDMVGHSLFMGAGNCDHVLVANTYINQHRLSAQGSTQAGPRIHSGSNHVYMDSRFRNMGRQSWRLHAPLATGNSEQVCFLRNDIVGSGIQLRANPGSPPVAEIRDVWLQDSTWYWDRNVIIQMGDGSVDDPYPLNVRYSGNRIYGGSLPAEPAGQGWTESDNISLGAYQDPPAWEFA